MEVSGRRPPRLVPAHERNKSIRLGANYTTVPNPILDLILPRLTPPEQACLLYIIRRTYGFAASTTHGERKQWDRIALSQFVSGNRSGGFVLDLGTGLARPQVVRALNKLEERGLVRVSYECPTRTTKNGRTVGCGWNEADEDHLTTPEIDPKTKAYRCPRCGRTLSKAYALRPLTPGFIKRFLTSTDPDGATWDYDPEVGHYYVGTPAPIKKKTNRLPSLQELRDQLWFPDLVDQIIAHAAAQNKTKRVSDGRIAKGFYLPVIELQRSGLPKDAMEYGLREVVKRKIAARRHNRNWFNYASACMRSYVERRHGSLEQLQTANRKEQVRERLRRCAELNRAGQEAEARQLLRQLLADHLNQLAEDFGGDKLLARRHLLEAFKRGLDDYEAVREYTVFADYLPNWSWEQDEQRASE